MAGKRILPRLVDPAKRVRSVGSRGALKAVVGHDGMMVGLAQLKNQYLEDVRDYISTVIGTIERTLAAVDFKSE